MNLWIVALIVGLLAVGVVFVAGIGTVNADSSEAISCETCGSGCTADRNCGSSTCGAVTGTGNCGCGR